MRRIDPLKMPCTSATCRVEHPPHQWGETDLVHCPGWPEGQPCTCALCTPNLVICAAWDHCKEIATHVLAVEAPCTCATWAVKYMCKEHADQHRPYIGDPKAFACHWCHRPILLKSIEAL